jgi:hypothetical protein
MANIIISDGIIILISYGFYHLITRKLSSQLITMCGSVEGFHLALVGSMDWFHGVYRTNQWVKSYNWDIYIYITSNMIGDDYLDIITYG